MRNKAQPFTTRQSMQGNQFEIFHYSDRKTSNVGVHHHDFYEVYFFLQGHVNYRVEGQPYSLQPGDLLLISPQELHEAQVDLESQYERIVLWLDKNYLVRLGNHEEDLIACFSDCAVKRNNLLRPDKLQRAQLQNILEKLTSEFYGEENGHHLYAEGLLIQFLIELNRLAKHTPSRHQEKLDRISQILSYIGAHYQENLTLQDLSEEFYMSPYYLSHEFHSRVGTSIYRYIMFKRLMQAKKMMDNGSTPGEVYQACGFGDYANFYRAFKKEFEVSPSEYTKGHADK